MVSVSRRRLFALGGVAAVAPIVALPGAASAAPQVAEPVAGAIADVYHRVLHLHTRWSERQWDESISAYSGADFRFVTVLGNAVLLTTPGYDATASGVPAAELKKRTVATIKRFAATNRLVGGDEWGKQRFWDSTFEGYFVLAARLLWKDLDERTRGLVQRIAVGQATYTSRLGDQPEPLSGELNEVADTPGARAQAVVAGLVWGSADRQRTDQFLTWIAGASGLPAADRANPARLDGEPVRDRAGATAMRDTFLIEYDGAADAFRQAEVFRAAARCAIHFRVAGKPVPQLLVTPPNGREVWRTLRLLASDAGEPVHPMVHADYHQYGRDVLPLAYLAQVAGDRHAARAEADLAARLEPYVRHARDQRLADGAPDRYEIEARSEIAIAYLLHRQRRTAVEPVSPEAFFAAAAGTRDFGAEAGLTVQQTTAGFAAAVTRTGFVNVLWQPRHDNWLVDASAAAFLPASRRSPATTWTKAWARRSDGVDATATVFGYGTEHAGFATLPTGTVIYASSGVARDEGTLTLFNERRAGIPGLTGKRTFTGAAGTITLDGAPGGGGDGGVDALAFEPRPARYVRMLGVEPAGEYGYSIWTFSVLDEAGGDLAVGAMPAASLSDVTYPASNATDGNPETRWSVDREQRHVADAWLAVDLGSTVTVAGVRIAWESAYGRRYVVQTSTDAVSWTEAAVVPGGREIEGRWLDVDGRAGLVTHGGDRPIRIMPTGVLAAAGEPAPVTIEGYARPVDLAAAAKRTLPAGPGRVRASDADGYLTVFNLGPDPIYAAVITLPSRDRLYRGTQTVGASGLEWVTTLDGGAAVVEPPRFTVVGTAPVGTAYTVIDSHHVTVTAPDGARVELTLRSGGWSADVRLAAGRSATFDVPGGTVTPSADLARGRTTFPTSPLPAGMTEPGNAVDGDGGTAWRPGTSGRMVVDLGADHEVSSIRLTWTDDGRRRPVRLERSTDGLTYTAVARIAEPERVAWSGMRVLARYVAVVVDGWQPGDAELTDLAVFG